MADLTDTPDSERPNKGSSLYPRHRLHTLEPHYSRHVGSMTSEGLRSKSDIAEQLAWRDQQIEALKADREHLGEGARLMFASHELGLVRDTAYGAALDRWLAAERIRQAKEPGK